jgi:hypothetical protein
MKTIEIEQKDPDINPHSYSQLIIDKGEKKNKWKKRQSLTNPGAKTGYPHVED